LALLRNGASRALRPRNDLGPEPQPCPTATQDHNRPRHVGIAALIDADRGALREAQEFRNTLCVDEVLGVDSRRHLASVALQLTYDNYDE
jgi:hypothetical protein